MAISIKNRKWTNRVIVLFRTPAGYNYSAMNKMFFLI